MSGEPSGPAGSDNSYVSIEGRASGWFETACWDSLLLMDPIASMLVFTSLSRALSPPCKSRRYCKFIHLFHRHTRTKT